MKFSIFLNEWVPILFVMYEWKLWIWNKWYEMLGLWKIYAFEIIENIVLSFFLTGGSRQIMNKLEETLSVSPMNWLDPN